MSTASPTRASVALTDEQRLHWLRLIRSEGVGPVTFRELMAHFGNAGAALEALPRIAARGGRRLRLFPQDAARAELAASATAGIALVAAGEPGYPPWLHAAEDAPPMLAVRGNHEALLRPMIAIVGSRNASIAGRKFAAMLADGLGAAGFVIASGLAIGIDAAAHEGSLATGTVAVFAGGLARLYPPENAALADRILAAGAHVSEMPLAAEPRAKDFPRRNRIISGLAIATIIVEAADRSGSLVTARTAAEQGRLVFAVPGAPLDPRAAGTNRLIREGATLVTSVDDVLNEVGPMMGSPAPPTGLAEPAREGPSPSQSTDIRDEDRARVGAALNKTPVTYDEIVRFTGLRPAVVHLIVLELDMAGRIERHPGQRISLI